MEIYVKEHGKINDHVYSGTVATHLSVRYMQQEQVGMHHYQGSTDHHARSQSQVPSLSSVPLDV
uniref:Uncharacterized protein n=1 Tax=Arundo donax TaxID=35708 RepID=A0A0A8YFG6_ARUDO